MSLKSLAHSAGNSAENGIATTRSRQSSTSHGGSSTSSSSIARFIYWLRYMLLIDSVSTFIARSSVYILPQAPFCDGLALMILFFQLPPWVTGFIRAAYLIILGIYGWPFCSGHSGGSSPFFAVFNHTSNSGGSSTYDLCPPPPNFLAVLTSDMVILIFMRIIPKFDHFVSDFSTGLVATSLAGAGPIVTFRNAAYCILLFYLFRCFLQFLSVLFSFSILTTSSDNNLSLFATAASYVTNLAYFASDISTTTTATTTTPPDLISSSSSSLDALSIPSSSFPTSSTEDLYIGHHDFGPSHNREEDTFLMLIHWIATAVSTHLIGFGFVVYIRRAFFADYSSNKPSNESPGNVASLNPQAHSTSVSSPISGQISNRYSSLATSPSSSSSPQITPSESPNETPSPETSDGIPTSAMNKRKRRIYTRLQQPLWSALATFIVATFRGRSSFLNIDINASILASAISYASTMFRLFTSRNKSQRDDAAIVLDNQYGCVRSISENDVVLEVLKVPSQDNQDNLGNNSNQPKIKKSLVRRPADFNDYAVRVNGILWPQVTIHLVKGSPSNRENNSMLNSASGTCPDRPVSSTSSNSSKDKDQSLLSFKHDNALVEDPPGEHDETLVVVTGLAQRTEYELELLHLYKGGDSSHVIFKTTISTLSRIGSSSYAPARPLSPMSTLLDTLTAASNELSEQRALIRRMRRDNARKIGQLRSEIDSLKSKVVGNDENQKKTEERSWRRVLALRESIRRNEDDIENLTEEIDRLNVEKLEVIAEHEARHAVYVENMQSLERDENTYQEAAASLEREKSAHLSEEAVLLVRLEKSSAKRARLQSDYDKEVEKLQNFGNAYLAKLRETRMATISRRLQIKESFAKAVKRLDDEAQEATEKTRILWDTMNQAPGSTGADSNPMLGIATSSSFREESNSNISNMDSTRSGSGSNGSMMMAPTQ